MNDSSHDADKNKDLVTITVDRDFVKALSDISDGYNNIEDILSKALSAVRAQQEYVNDFCSQLKQFQANAVNINWEDTPQAEQIKAVLERVNTLTDENIEALSERWEVPKNIYREIRDAVGNATHCAFLGEARYQAWSTAYNMVCGLDNKISVYMPTIGNAALAVADTVQALLARDLIDKNTHWNQSAYDILTGPWTKVIGPVHSDDRKRS